MIDVITKERVVVLWDDEYGPHIVLHAYQDSGAVEDLLDELWIPYNTMQSTYDPRYPTNGTVIYFGIFASQEEVQKFVDGINFDWNSKGWKEAIEVFEEWKSNRV